MPCELTLTRSPEVADPDPECKQAQWIDKDGVVVWARTHPGTEALSGYSWNTYHIGIDWSIDNGVDSKMFVQECAGDVRMLDGGDACWSEADEFVNKHPHGYDARKDVGIPFDNVVYKAGGMTADKSEFPDRLCANAKGSFDNLCTLPAKHAGDCLFKRDVEHRAKEFAAAAALETKQRNCNHLIGPILNLQTGEYECAACGAATDDPNMGNCKFNGQLQGGRPEFDDCGIGNWEDLGMMGGH